MASDDLTAWLRRVIEQDQAQARELIESEAAAPEWHEMTSGVLVTGPPEHDDHWSGTFAIGDSRITRYIAEHDPRDTIARCEAELAILGEYEAARKVMEEARDSPEGVGAGVWACVKSLRRAVELLGQGYRFRDGWRAEWRP